MKEKPINERIIDCMQFLDEHLTYNELTVMYEFCCNKFGADVVGVSSYILLAIQKGGIE